MTAAWNPSRSELEEMGRKHRDYMTGRFDSAAPFAEPSPTTCGPCDDAGNALVADATDAPPRVCCTIKSDYFSDEPRDDERRRAARRHLQLQLAKNATDDELDELAGEPNAESINANQAFDRLYQLRARKRSRAATANAAKQLFPTPTQRSDTMHPVTQARESFNQRMAEIGRTPPRPTSTSTAAPERHEDANESAIARARRLFHERMARIGRG